MDASGDTSAPRARAAAIAAHGSVLAAVDAGALAPAVTVPLVEAVLLGLFEQQVRSYVGVLGHGSTAIGEMLRVYSEAGAVRFVGFSGALQQTRTAGHRSNQPELVRVGQ